MLPPGTQGEDALKTVVAWLFACAVLVHATHVFAQEAQAPTAPDDSAATLPQSSDPPANAAPQPPPAEQPAPAPTAAPGVEQQPDQLESDAEPSVEVAQGGGEAAAEVAQEDGEAAASSQAVQPQEGEAAVEEPAPAVDESAAHESAADESDKAPMDMDMDMDMDTAAQDTLPAAAPLTVPDESNFGIEKLELKLRNVDAQREDFSQFLPWATVVFGTVATIGGTVAGSAYAFGCDSGECNTPSWIGMIVATGTLVATLGVIWVVRSDADRRELDSERYHLQEEIDRLRMSARQRYGTPSAAPLWSMQFALR